MQAQRKNTVRAMGVNRGHCRRELRDAPDSKECVQCVQSVHAVAGLRLSFLPLLRGQTPLLAPTLQQTYRSIISNLKDRHVHGLEKTRQKQTGLGVEKRNGESLSISPIAYSIPKGSE